MFSTARMLRCGRPLALGLISVLIVAALHAQSPPDASPANTLHLYARLVELPTLVLGPNNHPLPSLSPKAVNIKLDLRPSFHPSSLRLEGDDPISLAILIDTQGEEFALLTAFQKDFRAWLTSSFGPRDRISLYAMNCNLFRTAYNQPPDPALLKLALDSAIKSAMSDGEENDHAACHDPVGLRDYIDFIMKGSSPPPSRRVLLVLANGEDDKGVVKWQDLISDATLYAVTTFGINFPDPPLYQWGGSFDELSQRSGGLNMVTTPPLVSDTLSRMIHLLRQRYILQFPMPANLTASVHQVFVTVNKPTTLIRPSGITVPLNDPSTRTGPVNIPLGEPPANPTQPPTTNPPAPTPNY
jgi:hypothetical protein